MDAQASRRRGLATMDTHGVSRADCRNFSARNRPRGPTKPTRQEPEPLPLLNNIE